MSKERDTADAQLERILYILPAACKQGGATFASLATALGVPEKTIRNDIEQITAREYYHPAGSIDAFGIFMEDTFVEVQARGEFKRPVRLNAGEGLAVELGLRVLAMEAEPARRKKMAALGRRINKELTAPDTLPASSVEYDPEQEAEVLLAVGDDTVRGTISDAIHAQKRCTLTYVKPGEREPTQRHIGPQKLIYNDGMWYTLAYDYERKDTRFFRLDRVLDAVVDDAPAEVLKDLKWEGSENGFPYAADDDHIVEVRYAPCIARWITERTGEAPQSDGSVVVKHRVADPRWLVRHVLQYAGDATVDDPRYQPLVREAAQKLAAV